MTLETNIIHHQVQLENNNDATRVELAERTNGGEAAISCLRYVDLKSKKTKLNSKRTRDEQGDDDDDDKHIEKGLDTMNTTQCLENVRLRAFRSETLPSKLLEWCVHLVRRNLKDQYDASRELNWSTDGKRDEIKENGGVVLIAFCRNFKAHSQNKVPTSNDDHIPEYSTAFVDAPNMANDPESVSNNKNDGHIWIPIGFLSARFVLEDMDWEKEKELKDKEVDHNEKEACDGSVERIENHLSENENHEEDDDSDSNYEDIDSDESSNGIDKIAVMYCFEVQIDTDHRGVGLGAHFMHELIRLGKENSMRKVMLTVFKSNTAAIMFYKKLGFKADCISPENYLDERRAARVSYIIMSKWITFT